MRTSDNFNVGGSDGLRPAERVKQLTLLALRNMIKGNTKRRVAEKTGLMGSFGEDLKREREMRGVTLEEISAATKISVRFLKSIENEEFSRLPGGIFCRSFVRAYARYLGLDEDPLMEEYQIAAKKKGQVDHTRFTPPQAHSRLQRRTRRTLWTLVIAVGLLVLGLTLWRHSRGLLQASAATKSSSSSSSEPKAATAGAASAATPSSGNGPEANAQPVGGGVLAATSAVENGAPKLPPVTDTDGRLVLQVAATERAWVAIEADGKTVMQGVMNPNTLKTFKADTSFDVLTGNAQGVILSLNGHTLKPLGREGEVKQVHLTRNTLKKQTSN